MKRRFPATTDEWNREKNNVGNLSVDFADFIGRKLDRCLKEDLDSLPSQRDLAEQFGISRNTVGEALSLLVGRGVLSQTDRKRFLIKKEDNPHYPINWQSYMDDALFASNNMHNSLQRQDEKGRNSINLSRLLDERWDDLEGIKTSLSFMQAELTSLKEGHIKDLYDDLGSLKLRELICERAGRQGIHATPENVAVISRRLLCYQYIGSVTWGPQTELCLPDLSLQYFYGLGHRRIGKRLFLPSGPDWIDISPLKKSTRKKFLAIEPIQMKPTGLTLSTNQRKEIFEFCEGNKIPILEDLYCNDLFLDGIPPAPFASFDKDLNTVIHIGAIPCWALHGLEISWIIANKRLIEAVKAVSRRKYLSPSILEQLGAIHVLTSPDYPRLLARKKKLMQRKICLVEQLVEKELAGIASFEKPRTFGNAWIKFDSSVNIKKLFKNRRDIDFTPGFLYGERDNSHILIKTSLPDEDLIEGFSRLRKLIEVCQP